MKYMVGSQFLLIHPSKMCFSKRQNRLAGLSACQDRNEHKRYSLSGSAVPPGRGRPRDSFKVYNNDKISTNINPLRKVELVWFRLDNADPLHFFKIHPNGSDLFF